MKNIIIYYTGSASAHYHVISSESNSLFQRAIMMSGSTLNNFARYVPGDHMLHMFMIGEFRFRKYFKDVIKRSCVTNHS